MAKRSRSDFGSIFRRRKSDGRPVASNSKEPCRPGFYARLQVGGRQVWRKAGSTRAEAVEFVAKVRRDVFEETVLGVRPITEVTFEKFAEEYLGIIERTHSPTTLRSLRNKINNTVSPHFGTRTVSSIQREDVERFIIRRASSKSIATRNRDLSLLSAMFKKAAALGYCRENPVRGFARPSEPLRPVPFVDLAGQARLLAECHAEIRPLVLVALYTGLRLSELLRLEWRDVDAVRGSLTVRVSKNGKPRDIPLTGATCAELERLRDGRTIPLNAPDRVFAWIPESFPANHRKLYDDAVKAAELPHLRFHDLRHLCATNLVRAGTPLPDVGRMLGHKTLAMVLRYGHHSPTDATLRARDRLEAYLASTPAPDAARAAGS